MTMMMNGAVTVRKDNFSAGGRSCAVRVYRGAEQMADCHTVYPQNVKHRCLIRVLLAECNNCSLGRICLKDVKFADAQHVHI